MKQRIEFSFYGDDFTGSTDSMEALYLHGLDTLLFLEVPEEGMLEDFKDIDCIGFAGTSRAKSIQGMKKELDPVFNFIKSINPHYFHYKVCSTFDSSKEIGSIGYAADLARDYFKNKIYHTLVAVPQLARYTVFGDHYAKKDDHVYRLDEHPVVSVHPITPMNEPNLEKHLQKQTEQVVENVSVLDLENRDFSLKEDENKIVIYDCLNNKHLSKFANIAFNSGYSGKTNFIIGSSGVEYAYGLLKGKELNRVELGLEKKQNEKKEKTVFVVSGSLSSISKEQIEFAEKNGYHLVKLPSSLLDSRNTSQEFVEKIVNEVKQKKRVILYTAKGLDDPNVEEIQSKLKNLTKAEISEKIGNALGRYTKEIMEKLNMDILIVAGGDTSGYVMNELDVYALKIHRSVSPGAPLCVAYSKNERINESIIGLKGGQLGGIEYYKDIL